LIRVKICGITNAEDALAAVEYGADAVGFVFFKNSPRHILPEKAFDIISLLPPFVTTVGVFVNEDPRRIQTIIRFTGINVVQLHGNEPPHACSVAKKVIKAFRVTKADDLQSVGKYNVAAFLLDSHSPDSFGGTGKTFNWDIAREAKKFGRIILSGGLTAGNVGQAIQHVGPYAVDVSSGVEAAKGKKDLAKLKAFIAQARTALTLP
jgi:phosphoribosylanthranilate isomerase